MNRLLITILSVYTSIIAFCQQNDETVYDFLRMPFQSRSVGLGGRHCVTGEDEVGMWIQNPALLTDTLSGNVGFYASPLTDGIWTGAAVFAHHFESIGNMALAIQHIGYGSIDATDEYGSYLGKRSSHEDAISITYSKELAPGLNLGATIRPVWSSRAGKSSFGICMDFGILGQWKEGRLRTALSICNVGGQLSNYDADGSTSRESLRPYVSLGIVYKPEHAPFRMQLTIKDLHQWDLTPMETNSSKLDFADNLMRHCIWGLEFQPVKVFYFSFGYDQRKRRELRISSAGGAAGLSWGLGVKIAKRLDFRYAMSRYHIAGTLNSIGLSARLWNCNRN